MRMSLHCPKVSLHDPRISPWLQDMPQHFQDHPCLPHNSMMNVYGSKISSHNSRINLSAPGLDSTVAWWASELQETFLAPGVSFHVSMDPGSKVSLHAPRGSPWLQGEPCLTPGWASMSPGWVSLAAEFHDSRMNLYISTITLHGSRVRSHDLGCVSIAKGRASMAPGWKQSSKMTINSTRVLLNASG